MVVNHLFSLLCNLVRQLSLYLWILFPLLQVAKLKLASYILASYAHIIHHVMIIVSWLSIIGPTLQKQ